MKIKFPIIAAIVLLVLVVISVSIRAVLATPDTEAVRFAEFRTNTAGHLEAFYFAPLTDLNRSFSFVWVQRLRGSVWTNEVKLHTDRLVDQPTLVWVPLSAGGELPRPREVCRVVSYVASESWDWRLRRRFNRVWPTGLPIRSYNRLRWTTNELTIPQPVPSGPA